MYTLITPSSLLHSPSVEHRARPPPILAGSHLTQHELPCSQSPPLLQHCQGSLPQRGKPALPGTQVRFCIDVESWGLRTGTQSPMIEKWGMEPWDRELGHGPRKPVIGTGIWRPGPPPPPFLHTHTPHYMFLIG